MDTLYFVGFCLFVAYLIYWMVQNDDLDEFTGEEVDKRFKPKAKKKDDPS